MKKWLAIAAGLGGLSGLGAWFWLSKKPAPSDQATAAPLQPWQNIDFSNLLSGDSELMNKPYQNGGGTPLSKGIRNNNPLNIEYGAPWQGLTGSDGRFATFESAWFGIRAAGRTLKTYRDKYGINTVAGIVNRWAPPSDNNPTQNYINFVASKAGVNPNQALSDGDYINVVAAMITFENGYQPYEKAEIASAVRAGLA